MKKFYTLAALSLVALACSEDSAESNGPNGSIASKQEIIENFIELSNATYKNARSAYFPFSSAFSSFRGSTNHQELDYLEAQHQWRFAMEHYMLTVPIGLSTEFVSNSQTRLRDMNLWPVNESYLNGIISNSAAYPDVKAGGLHMAGGPENITRGFHVMEFLLWGPDNTDPSLNLPGQQTYESLVPIAGPNDLDPKWRRGSMVTGASEIIINSLVYYDMETSPGNLSSADITQELLGADQNVVILNIFKGTALAIEDMATNHLEVPFSTNNPELEHSAYSDNSLADLKMGFEGVYNLYYGIKPSYLYSGEAAIDGAGINELVTGANSSLANEINLAFTSARNAANAIPAPLDNAIATQDNRVADAIAALQQLKQKLIAGANAAGYTIN